MFDFLLRKWKEGEIDESDIDFAMAPEQGWITSEEGAQIKSTPKNINSEVV